MKEKRNLKSRNGRKMTAMALSVVMAASTAFTGCGKDTGVADGDSQTPSSYLQHFGNEDGNGGTDTGNGSGADGNTSADVVASNSGNGSGADGGSSGASASGSSAAGSGAAIASVISDRLIPGLSETGSGYEGTKGTGKYNYGEALQKSLLFYELQRSGQLPDGLRCNWRGDSALSDGSDVGLDLSGGWFDAGDNVKFNLPMAYTASVLAWSVYEDRDAYEESGQLSYALSNIKWANDYFIKCHPKDEVYYYQVGDGNQDHTWWGPAELVETRMSRPSYSVTASNPGSCVTGETAASLAACAVIFEKEDKDYSKTCLTHAKSLYEFAKKYKSDAGYTAANGFYTSNSGFYDELSWAAAWLYIATGEKSYLEDAKTFYASACQDYIWAMCWDDVHIGAALLLARITEEDTYKNAVETHLDWWTTGTAKGERINYTPKGLAWLDNWGSVRYATTTAFVASVYSEWKGCDSKKAKTYWDFAVSQAGYALGDTGFSYMIGFGDKYPVHPHHRTSQGSYADNMNEPGTARHTLYGALVGGPDASDNYTDEVSNYNTNEVACDYNAGFTGLLAKLYSVYKGQTLKDFGAVEPVTGDEYLVESGVNVFGNDFVEIKAFVYNETAWPARSPQTLEMRYFMDLSEVYAAGKTAADVVITTNYVQDAAAGSLTVWDEDKDLYYLPITFSAGSIYPGGQQHYKKEVQVRMRCDNIAWNNDNDPSFADIDGNNVRRTESVALYEDGVLVFGHEPREGAGAGTAVSAGNTGDGSSNNNGGSSSNGNGNGTTNAATSGSGQTSQGGSGTSDGLALSIKYDNQQTMSGSISGSMDIKNNTDGSISLKDLQVEYYFTKDANSQMAFACYHSATTDSDGSYYGSLSGVTGAYSDVDGSKDGADTLCTISISDDRTLSKGDTLTINFSMNHSDWVNMDTGNDYSGKSVENIVVTLGGEVIYGTRP